MKKPNYHPILFSTAMQQANLRKEKTETRRLNNLWLINEFPGHWELLYTYNSGACMKNRHNGKVRFVRCPFGWEGDLLWVRETWRPWRETDATGEWKTTGYVYLADPGSQPACGGWTPSIHMPKEACRCWLENMGIGIERLQSITAEGAMAEGIQLHVPVPGHESRTPGGNSSTCGIASTPSAEPVRSATPGYGL